MCVCACVCLRDLQDDICVSEKWGIFKNCFWSGQMMINHGFGGTDFEINPNRKINDDEIKQHVERLILVGHFASYF